MGEEEMIDYKYVTKISNLDNLLWSFRDNFMVGIVNCASQVLSGFRQQTSFNQHLLRRDISLGGVIC